MCDEHLLKQAKALGELSAMSNEKKYRIVLDGNGDFRIQFQYASNGMTSLSMQHWTFDPRKFKSAEDAERSIGEYSVARVIKVLN